MKYIRIFSLAILAMLAFQSCDDDESTGGPIVEVAPDVSGTYVLADQMGRPAINTVFVSADNKNDFNTTVPSQQAAKYGEAFGDRLRALSPTFSTDDDKNLLGLNATDFGNTLATDVLTVSLDGLTTFASADLSTVLTGRQLTDDVITTELTLIFGGETGGEVPTLSDDNVDANDKAFLTTFPYLAAPF